MDEPPPKLNPPVFDSPPKLPNDPSTAPDEDVFSPSTPRFPPPPLDADPNTLETGAGALPPPKLDLTVDDVALLSRPLDDGIAIPPKVNPPVAGAAPNVVPIVEDLSPAVAPNEKPPPAGAEVPPLPLEPNENPPPPADAGAGVLLLVPKLNAMSEYMD